MNDMKVISCSREIAGRNVTLETGKVARQATGSVIASSGCLLYTSPSPRD